jgi:chemotaxis protein CheD
VNHVIGIAEMQVSNRREDVLVTYSLGSCIGLTLYDPQAGVGGMIHCMLPLSKMDEGKARANPTMFTDTGVLTLLQSVFNMGAERKNLVAKVAGGAMLLDEKGLFRIGERNQAVLRKVLWKNNILIASEEVGGTIPRTLTLYMADGRTTVKTHGVEKNL